MKKAKSGVSPIVIKNPSGDYSPKDPGKRVPQNPEENRTEIGQMPIIGNNNQNNRVISIAFDFPNYVTDNSEGNQRAKTPELKNALANLHNIHYPLNPFGKKQTQEYVTQSRTEPANSSEQHKTTEEFHYPLNPFGKKQTQQIITQTRTETTNLSEQHITTDEIYNSSNNQTKQQRIKTNQNNEEYNNKDVHETQKIQTSQNNEECNRKENNEQQEITVNTTTSSPASPAPPSSQPQPELPPSPM